jgi:hypothetical protein
MNKLAHSTSNLMLLTVDLEAEFYSPHRSIGCGVGE